GGSEITVIGVSDPNNCTYITSYGTKSDNQSVWGLSSESNKINATYISAIIPYPENWNGVKCIKLLN
ncbi:MAG: hypothetical protein HRT69_18565, partial [Flavobacteriaceae bacterium]|nr:hypothetical protein [Flavobacteriaceae bacterium]